MKKNEIKIKEGNRSINIDDSYIHSLRKVCLELGIFSYPPPINEIRTLIMNRSSINSVIEFYANEQYYYYFSYMSIEEKLMGYLEDDIIGVNNHYKIFMHELAKFTNFFFHPDYSSIKVKNFEDYFLVEIVYEGEKYLYKYLDGRDVYAAMLELVNQIIKKKNAENPLLYCIELFDGFGIICLTKDQFDLVYNSNFLIFSSLSPNYSENNKYYPVGHLSPQLGVE